MKILKSGFCIFVDAIPEGCIPSVVDGAGNAVIFQTEREAQEEIVDHALTRLLEFKKGEREFDDALVVDEFVVAVMVQSNRSVTDGTGRNFGKRE